MKIKQKLTYNAHMQASSNTRICLNSDIFPYERLKLIFNKELHFLAYYAFEEFYESMLSFDEFREKPLFLINCPHEAEVTDIKLVFEIRQ